MVATPWPTHAAEAQPAAEARPADATLPDADVYPLAYAELDPRDIERRIAAEMQLKAMPLDELEALVESAEPDTLATAGDVPAIVNLQLTVFAQRLSDLDEDAVGRWQARMLDWLVAEPGKLRGRAADGISERYHPETLKALWSMRESVEGTGLAPRVNQLLVRQLQDLGVRGEGDKAAALLAHLGERVADPWVAASAWEEAVRLARGDRFIELVTRAMDAGPGRVREVVLQTAANDPVAEIAPAVFERLESLGPAEQAAAMRIFARSEAREALFGLLKGTNSTDDGVFFEAVRGLGQFPEALAVNRLMSLALDGELHYDHPRRRVAERALSRLAGPEGTELIRGALRSAGGRVMTKDEEMDEVRRRALAVKLVGRREATAALESLYGYAESPHFMMRSNAIKAINELATPQDIPRIARLMLDLEDLQPIHAGELREGLAKLTAELDTPQAVSPIVLALIKEGDDVVDAEAVRLTPATRDPRMLQMLGAILDDALARTAMREAATDALLDWPGPEAGPMLVARIADRDESPKVREGARESLIRLLREHPEQNPQGRASLIKEAIAGTVQPQGVAALLRCVADLPADLAGPILEPYVRAITGESSTTFDEAIQRVAIEMTVLQAGKLAAVDPDAAAALIERIQTHLVNPERLAMSRLKQWLAAEDGRIVHWELSGPFWMPRVQGDELFAVLMGPELGRAAFAELEELDALGLSPAHVKSRYEGWRPWAIVPTPGRLAQVDPVSIFERGDRAVYLRTHIAPATHATAKPDGDAETDADADTDTDAEATTHSPAPTPYLRLNTENLVKVWFNGRLIHADDTHGPLPEQRPLIPLPVASARVGDATPGGELMLKLVCDDQPRPFELLLVDEFGQPAQGWADRFTP